MIDLDTLRVMHRQYADGLGNLRAKEAAAMEARLRQEGAVLAVEQLLRQAEQGEQAVAAIAVPLQEEVSDGGNY